MKKQADYNRVNTVSIKRLFHRRQKEERGRHGLMLNEEKLKVTGVYYETDTEDMKVRKHMTIMKGQGMYV